MDPEGRVVGVFTIQQLESAVEEVRQRQRLSGFTHGVEHQRDEAGFSLRALLLPQCFIALGARGIHLQQGEDAQGDQTQHRERRGDETATVTSHELRSAIGERVGSRLDRLVREIATKIVRERIHACVAFARLATERFRKDVVEIGRGSGTCDFLLHRRANSLDCGNP